jgi:hypothetical protein
MDLDAGKKTPEMRDKATQKEKFPRPEAVGQSVKEHRMKPRITEHNFKNTPDRRIPIKYCLQVLF